MSGNPQINNPKEFIKLTGEEELKAYIFSKEEYIRYLVGSINFVPKDSEGVKELDKLIEFYNKVIDLVRSLTEKTEEELENEAVNILKEKYPEVYKVMNNETEEYIDLAKFLTENFVGLELKVLDLFRLYSNPVIRWVLMKLIDYIINELEDDKYKEQVGFVVDILNKIDFYKNGKVRESEVKKALDKLVKALEVEEKKKESLEETIVNEVVTDLTPEILQNVLEKQLKEEKVLYKEEFEDDYYEINIIPFIRVQKIKTEEDEHEVRIKKIEFTYGVVSNKYILIKDGIIMRKKEGKETSQSIFIDEKITNIINYNGKFIIIKFMPISDNEGEEIAQPLKLEGKKKDYDFLAYLIKKVSITENYLNSKIGFYFRAGTLKANYVKGYGVLSHGDITMDFGSPISLIYPDEKVEQFFFDYYSFKNSLRYFEEKPPLYNTIIRVFKELKERQHPYLNPFIVTIGFTLSSIYIELFKKKEALFPAVYFYGVSGTGKSLLLKISRSMLGIDTNKVCESFAQFRDLMSASNNIGHLDEVPEKFGINIKGLKEVLKNLLTNLETIHTLSGKDGDSFVMRGSFFVTTNYSIGEVFGNDEALEARLIFTNFNYDNKAPEDISEEIKRVIETEVTEKPVPPTIKAYTHLSNVIYLYYQLIKKGLHKESKVLEIYSKLDNQLKGKLKMYNIQVTDFPRFKALVLPIYFGAYIFSEVTGLKEFFEYLDNNLKSFVDWLLEEHPSYKNDLRESIYFDFVKFVGRLDNLISEDVFDLEIVEDDKYFEIRDEKIKNKIFARLSYLGEDLDVIVFIKIDNDYYLITKERYIKQFYKEHKDFYNHKKILDLLNDLERVGIKEAKSLRIKKKTLILDKNNKKIEIATDENPKMVRIRLFKIPRFIVEKINSKLIITAKTHEKRIHIENEVKIEGKQTKIWDFIEKAKEKLEEVGVEPEEEMLIE